MKSQEMLSDKEVTGENLLSILNKAFISAEFDDDDDLIADVDGQKIILTINKSNKLLKYTALYRLKNSFPLELKHSLINLMNDDVIFSRFSIPDQDPNVLVSDYYLPYEAGILGQHVVSSLRLMARVNNHAIHNLDPNDIIN